MEPDMEIEEYLSLKYIPEHVRKDIPESDFAGPGRTYPIRNQDDLEHAAMLLHHASDPTAVRDKAIRIARRKGLRLPESWEHHAANGKDTMSDNDADNMKSFDTLIYQGGEVKALDTDGKIGGHILLFTTKNDPDRAGDYFDSDTDFDIEDGDRLSGYYEHGFDVKLANRKIGRGFVSKDSKGLWMEAQLDKREEYIKELIELVDAGALGYSTGALSHLVRREAKNKAGTLSYVTHWPLKEWSLVPEPCEPRTLAIPLKSWVKSLRNEESTESPAGVGGTENIMTLRELERALRDGVKFSSSQAKRITSRFALRDVEAETITQEIKSPPIDETDAFARQMRIERMFTRFEGYMASAQ